MAEHLSPLDAMFLELEQADESAQMHIGAVTMFDPPALVADHELRVRDSVGRP